MAFRIFSSLNKAQEIWSEGHCSASSDAPVFAFFVHVKDVYCRRIHKDFFWSCYEEISADNVVKMIPAFHLIVLKWT